MRGHTRSGPVSAMASVPAVNRVKPALTKEARDRDGRVKYSTLDPRNETGRGNVSGSRSKSPGPHRMSLGPNEHGDTSIDLHEQTRGEYADYMLPEIFSSAESPASNQVLDSARHSKGGNNLNKETRFQSRYDSAR